MKEQLNGSSILDATANSNLPIRNPTQYRPKSILTANGRVIATHRRKISLKLDMGIGIDLEPIGNSFIVQPFLGCLGWDERWNNFRRYLAHRRQNLVFQTKSKYYPTQCNDRKGVTLTQLVHSCTDGLMRFMDIHSLSKRPSVLYTRQ